MTTYKYKNRKVNIEYTTYANNNSLAVQMFSASDHELYTVITVNLCSMMQDGCFAFVDENNNPGIGKWLEANKIAVPTGFIEISGFCHYQLYAFNNA